MTKIKFKLLLNKFFECILIKNLKYKKKDALGDSQREYTDLKQHNADLIMRLSQLEEELDTVRRNNGFGLDQRDRDIAEMRANLQQLMGDYDELMNNKASLEFEINTYRRLLESEETRTTRVTENRYKSTTTTASSSVYRQPPPSKEVSPPPVYQTGTVAPSADLRLSSTEMSSKTTFQRSAKGPVSISECSPDGKVIILENTSRNKDITMTNWVLKRRVDSKEEITYKFPSNLVLKANKLIRIWARGHGKENLPTDLVNKDIENWGMGVNIVTIVLNDVGDEKATHLQKTVYAS